MSEPTPERVRAVMAAVQLPDADDGAFASSIAELRRLATTLGLEVVGAVTQRRGRPAPGLVLGEGKVRELALWTGGSGEVPAYQKLGTNKKDAQDEDEDEDGDDVVAAPEGDDADGEEAADATPGHEPDRARATVVLGDHVLTAALPASGPGSPD